MAVFFDISKAFDSIDHKLLLYKLEKMGIRGRALDLMNSYLNNRVQYVKVMDELSEIAAILFGVPQGSCLGPLLFVMLLYDLKYVDISSSILKYADDVVLLLTLDKLDDLLEVISKDINEIKNYYASNGMKLNASKSKYMTFGFSTHHDLDKYMKLQGIERTETIKYLGSIVDSKLRMNGHADHLIKKISQSVNAMNIVKSYLPINSLLQFYNAFIGSYLYNSSFLMCRLNIGDVNRLQRIQNKSLKIAYGLDRDFSTEKLFMEVAINVLPVIGIAYYNLLLLTKKYILLSPDDFEIITEGRRKNQIKFPRFKKNILADDLICLGPRIYNQLPLEIREIKNINLFKNQLKKFLLDKKIIFLRGGQLDVNKLFESA